MTSNTQTKLAIEGLAHDLNNVLQTIPHPASLVPSGGTHAGPAAIIARSVGQCRRILRPEGSAAPASLAEAIENAAAFAQDALELSGGKALELAAHSAGRECVRAAIEAFRSSGELVIQAADDGPGIPGHLLHAIFTPRFSTSHGAGLGLHIVSSVVQDLGGTVSAANAPTGGAVFTIRLPEKTGTTHSPLAAAASACAD